MGSMMQHNRLGLPRDGARRPLLSTCAGTALAAVLVFAACDGDNLFSGSGTRLGAGPPVVASVAAPESVAEGGRLDVRIKAIAPRGMTRIDVRFRRGVNAEQEFTFENRTDSVTVDASIDVPADAADSVIVVEAFATDQTGRVSDVVSRTIRIIDSTPPVVTLTSSSALASPGGDVQLRINARDQMGLQSVGYIFISSTGDTLLRATVPTTGSTRDTTFTVRLPTTVPGSEIRVIGIAINSASLRGVSAPLVLALSDSIGPHVEILEPLDGESYTRGSPLRVRVHVRDSASGLSEVRIRGVAFRNFPDTLQNATPVIRYPEIIVPLPQGPDRPSPVDTIVVRDLLPNADITVEPVFIIAEARDIAGNIGVDTVRLIPGPRVTILNPTTGAIARVNSQMQVRVQAIDPVAGIDSLKLYLSGVQTETIVVRGLGATRELVEITPLINIGGQTGTLDLRADVWNSQGARGSTPQSVRVIVSEQLASDTVAPRVLRVVQTADRIELGDSIRINVRATDDAGSGIVRMGAVVIVIPANEGPGLPRDTFFFSTPTFASPRTGTPDTTFIVRLSDTYRETGTIRFPQAFTLQVHAYAIDAQGNCGASVLESYQSLPCQSLGADARIAAGQTGQVRTVTGVVGTSVRLPTGSLIADALPDTTRSRVYLSNFARNQVEVLNLADTTIRATPVLVGSQPWGLFLSGDTTLIVGNSGGTNLSFVSPETLRETRRLLTPNDRLFNVRLVISQTVLQFSTDALEFSDRPQFVAQDANGVFVYSTRPTDAALEGTVRKVIADPSYDRPESKIIFGADAVILSDNSFALAYVDSVVVKRPAAGDDRLEIWDHVPGFPTMPLVTVLSVGMDIDSALVAIGSDGVVRAGAWARSRVGFADTTYVAYSKDLRTLAFGEGGVSPFARILLYGASTNPAFPDSGRVSSEGTIDLIGNAAEAVAGLALSANGRYGVARGLNSTYYFSNDMASEGQLRLQGVFAQGASGGNGGVALHPNHADAIVGADPTTTLSFIATSSRTIKIVDTVHYFERGEIPIRDNIVGQLRAIPPLTGVNTGVATTSCDYTIAQLVGVTDSNNVVIVNVRNRDILKGGLTTCVQ
ncbi:MAG TPA: hypothetical protein VMN60_10555 [Longimicrobiales bacterium]|nr:hypothetical protein [Longimicrobiales bacterium]